MAVRMRRLAILSDDSSAQPRSTLIAPAQEITSTIVNEMLSLTGGITFVALSPQRVRAFLLDPMSRPRMNSPSVGISEIEQILRDQALSEQSLSPLNGLESVEAREGVSTGISASDRALTISILGEPSPVPRKLVRPGHIFPLEVKEGGVLVKNALPEGAVDLVTLSGFTDAAVCIDMLGSSGEFMSLEEVKSLSSSRDIPHFLLSDLTRLRLEHEHLVTRVAEAKLPTRCAGEMKSVLYRSSLHDEEHLALVKGEINPEVPVLVRVQPEFTFGDVFGASEGSTRHDIERCLHAIGERGSGVFLYLRRPFGTQLGEQRSTSPFTPAVDSKRRPMWMMREYGLGAQILRDLGVRKAEVLTGSTRNLVGLNSFGIEIVAQVRIPS
jgi:3,4-dihydroxy 2-butanone 4-phosphate synthase/GTP cyclohydrolase II